MHTFFQNPKLRYAVKVLSVILAGLAGGYLYYFVGCANGTCTIASSPVNSTLYGGMIGLVLGLGFVKAPRKEKSEN